MRPDMCLFLPYGIDITFLLAGEKQAKTFGTAFLQQMHTTPYPHFSLFI